MRGLLEEDKGKIGKILKENNSLKLGKYEENMNLDFQAGQQT